MSDKHSILTDDEWEDIFDQTSSFYSDKFLIYSEFDNNKFSKLLSKVYKECSDLGYVLNDSISYCINNRSNRSISNRVKRTLIDRDYITDTVEYKNKYVVYSEPIAVSHDVVLVALSNFTEKVTDISFAFVLKKESGCYTIIAFYDVQEKQYFKSVPM